METVTIIGVAFMAVSPMLMLIGGITWVMVKAVGCA